MTGEALEKADRLVDAEDFLDLFEIPYDPHVVRVNRLHILKKFALLKAEVDDAGEMPAEDRFTRYREAMQRAYATFLVSSGPEEKLFKVFQGPSPVLMTIEPAAPAQGGD